MDTVKLGVIGTGLAWQRLHYPAVSQLRFEVGALCSANLQEAEAEAQKIGLDRSNVYTDYKDILSRDDIIAVDLCVPIESTSAIAIDVINSGKHLICEKPIADDLSEAQKLITAAKDKNSVVVVAENFRYNEETLFIKDLLRQNSIGTPVCFMYNASTDFEAKMTGDTFEAKEWRQHPEFYGGSFLDGGIHDMARLRTLFGEIQAIHALGTPQKEQFNDYMVINANMKFDSGVSGQYTYFCEGKEAFTPPVGLRIYGTRGEIYLQDKMCGNIVVAHNNGQIENVAFTPDRGYYNEFLNFYNVINGHASNECSLDLAYGDVKAVMDVLDSIKLGIAVGTVDFYNISNSADNTGIGNTGISNTGIGNGEPMYFDKYGEFSSRERYGNFLD